MSSKVVRDSFKAELAAAFPTLPQYDTLAVRVDNTSLPALWATTEFTPISYNAVSIGMPALWREIGTFRCYVLAAAGAGEAAAIAQLDAIIAHFKDWRDAVNQIRVAAALPPAPSEVSDGRWLVSFTDITFSHDNYV